MLLLNVPRSVAVGVTMAVEVLVTTMTEPPGSVEEEVITDRDVNGWRGEMVEDCEEEEDPDLRSAKFCLFSELAEEHEEHEDEVDRE